MKEHEMKKGYGVLFALSFILDLMVVFWNPSPEHKIYFIILVIVVIVKDFTYYTKYRKIKNQENQSPN